MIQNLFIILNVDDILLTRYRKYENEMLYEFNWKYNIAFHQHRVNWVELFQDDWKLIAPLGAPWGKQQCIKHINNPMNLMPVTRIFIRDLVIDPYYYINNDYRKNELEELVAPEVCYYLGIDIKKLLSFERQLTLDTQDSSFANFISK